MANEVLRVFNKNISDSYVRKIRRDNSRQKNSVFEINLFIFSLLDYVYRRTRPAPMLSESDKLKRYLWCKQNERNEFKDYLFVDESTIRLLEIPLYHSRKKGSVPKSIPQTSKRRLKLNVWGGISFRGPTPFAVTLYFNIFFICIDFLNFIAI